LYLLISGFVSKSLSWSGPYKCPEYLNLSSQSIGLLRTFVCPPFQATLSFYYQILIKFFHCSIVLTAAGWNWEATWCSGNWTWW